MKKFRFEIGITLLYVLFGSLWILFSDKAILFFVKDIQTLTRLQTYKGWFYVLVTGIFFYFLLKKHLKKLKTIENDLKREKERAEEHNELKTAFIANISHEIRTPMNAIVGFSDLIKTPNLAKEKVNQYSRYIAKNGKQLLGIVNNLLDISKIESGQIELIKSDFSVFELLNDLYSNFKVEADTKFIDLLFEKDIESDNDIIFADRVKLQQIVSNLLTNALKFTKDGFVKFGYHFEEQYISFYVEDTGIGIDAKHHSKILERFWQVEKGISKKYSGTGLGLAICKSYVDLMNGQIWVNSSLGKGTRFSFTIPYEAVIKKNEKESEFGSSIDWKAYTILVAEDKESNFVYISELLGKTQANLLHVDNGHDAVQLCKSNRNIDLVLMDVKMPMLHGFDATRAIKKTRPDLPIIAQTAFAMSHDKEAATKAGCDGYISKPMEAKKLIDLIAKHLPQ